MGTSIMHTRLVHVLGVFALLGACQDPAGNAETPAAASAPAVTYYRDIKPIIDAKCAQCHVTGGVAPFALTDPQEVVERAATIKAYTASKEMPPWPPGPASLPLLHDRSLSEAQIALIGTWADLGAPLGAPEQAGPALPRDVVDIGKPDLSVDTGVDFAPDPTVADEYRCFLIDLKNTETRTAVGMRVTPGNALLVHHVGTDLYAAEDRAALEGLAGKDGRPGWSCFGSLVPDELKLKASGSLGNWVPGTDSAKLPEGVGTVVAAGALVVMQIHYHLHPGTTLPDRTKLDVAFAPKGTEAQLVPLRGVRLHARPRGIPLDAKDVVVTDSKKVTEWTGGRFSPKGQVNLRGVSAHMHLLGTTIQITVTSDQGVVKVLDIPQWNYHWQGGYQLVTPIPIKSTDVVGIRCTYDNTAAQRSKTGYPGAPRVVMGGESSEDEMCTGTLTWTEP